MATQGQGRRTVVIVGGGFSGAAVARTLLIEGPAHLRVILVNDADEVGRGLAYRTGNLSHLLNVPVGRLGIDPDDEAAFGRWLSSMALRHRSSDFVPRHLLGRYVGAELDAASSRASCSWQILNGHARDIRRGSESRFDVALSDGRVLAADSVVIATGHPKPLLPPFSGNASWHDDDMVSDPWRAPVEPDATALGDVLVVGTGLTALDVVSQLRGSGHCGRIHLLSRRGLLPQPHRANELQPPTLDLGTDVLPERRSLRALVSAVRFRVRAHQQSGGDWRGVMAGLRPLTPALWAGLDARARRQFLRHVLPFWDTHRHRVAPQIHERLQHWMADGSVTPLRGRLVSIDRRDDGRLDFAWRARGAEDPSRMVVDRVINCTGTCTDLARDAGSVLASLRDGGRLLADELGLGLHVDDRLRVIDRAGNATPCLHYVGPLLKAQFWEAVAIPELRVHARTAARAILADVASRRCDAEAAAMRSPG